MDQINNSEAKYKLTLILLMCKEVAKLTNKYLTLYDSILLEISTRQVISSRYEFRILINIKIILFLIFSRNELGASTTNHHL